MLLSMNLSIICMFVVDEYITVRTEHSFTQLDHNERTNMSFLHAVASNVSSVSALVDN